MWYLGSKIEDLRPKIEDLRPKIKVSFISTIFLPVESESIYTVTIS
jgi:hypothetical protein